MLPVNQITKAGWEVANASSIIENVVHRPIENEEVIVMVLVYNGHSELIVFGVEKLKRVLERCGIAYFEQYAYRGVPIITGESILVTAGKRGIDAEESFTIARQGETVRISGSDDSGAMYGLLEYAEYVESGKILADGECISKKPFLKTRGIKFNLPYIPFQAGEPSAQNEEICMDFAFWEKYIDMLAENRYNCLSLWSENPFHMFSVSSKYRAATPFDDMTMEKHISLMRGIISHCRNRGIFVYLFTWNIRITPDIAKGLGLPEMVGFYEDAGSRTDCQLNYFRRNSELIKDYFYQMVVNTLLLYPELRGIGVSASEWMDGNGFEREAWIADTYVRAVKDVGSKIKFIHRTNMQQAGQEIQGVQKMFAKEDFAINWKYSMAHCYSHPRPQFEKLWKAWDGVEPDSVNILYTVRNDDVMTLRWYNHEYVKQYVEGMKRPNVEGFYWGADGYLWGKDFQHIDYGHKTWRYDYERIEAQFQLWGRLSYDPDVPEEVFIKLAERKYTKKYAVGIMRALSQASRIIPAVNRLFWINYDYQWHPESCLSAAGFKTVLDFMDGKAMPGVGVMGLKEYAACEHEGTLSEKRRDFEETPAEIIGILRQSADNARMLTEQLETQTAADRYSHVECTLMDLQVLAQLGCYYANKFEAALELNRYLLDRAEQHKDRAVQLLEAALSSWENLAFVWSQHYKPYELARVHMTFGYPYYIKDVKNDIMLAKQLG